MIFDGRPCEAALYQRDMLKPGDAFTGPAVVVEYSATTAMPPGCRARVDGYGNVVIQV